MAVRQIVKIDEDKCNGCGDCVPACAEGAIQIIDGKAKLVADNLCDGLGNCLGDCPMDAISIIERDAEEFDETAVELNLKKATKPKGSAHAAAPAALHRPAVSHGGGCPGSRVMFLGSQAPAEKPSQSAEAPSRLRQWPVQLHLVPPTAPYFQGANVLLAADCVPFAMGDFHNKLLAGRSLAIACPKLDSGQDVYLDKLVSMIDEARIDTLAVAVMEVPCCTGLVRLAQAALERSERKVPLKLVKVSLRGEVIEERWI